MMTYLSNKLRFLIILLCIVSSAFVHVPQMVAAQSSKARSRIVFVAFESRSRTETLSLVDPVSKAVMVLVKDGYFFSPMFSPDGKHLAFMAEHPTEGLRNIYIMETDGSNLRQLLPDKPTLKPLGRVAWSPDSTQIIFSADYRGGTSAGYFRVKLGDSNPSPIKFGDIKYFADSWVVSSPDGNHLAVRVSTDTSPNMHLYIANADGSNPHPITSSAPTEQTFDEIVWSPDNQKTLLAVGLTRPNEAPSPIMVADADGANAKIVIKATNHYYSSIAWSPTGSEIAFVAPENNDAKPNGEIWVANANGAGLHMLNIPGDVAPLGISWAVIPDEVVLPGTPTSFTGALKR